MQFSYYFNTKSAQIFYIGSVDKVICFLFFPQLYLTNILSKFNKKNILHSTGVQKGLKCEKKQYTKCKTQTLLYPNRSSFEILKIFQHWLFYLFGNFVSFISSMQNKVLYKCGNSFVVVVVHRNVKIFVFLKILV